VSEYWDVLFVGSWCESSMPVVALVSAIGNDDMLSVDASIAGADNFNLF
jgi:hypothetical protein